MERSVVFTFVGPDRPGLVDRISALVEEHGGNWEESRLSRLAGQFAGIVEVSVTGDGTARLIDAMQGLAQDGLSVVCVECEAEPQEPDYQVMAFEVLGHDRPGIVHEISHAFAGAGIGVIEMATGVFAAPMSGESMFSADLVVEVPDTVDLDALHEALDDIRERLAVDIDLVEEEDDGERAS